MKPKEVLEKWIDCFNKADAYHIAELYATNAVNHQVANEPIIGKESIYKMFVNEFATAKMVCMVENIFEDGEWAIMEWKDSLGLRGCGFFHVKDNKIVFQRGYWDKLSFLKPIFQLNKYYQNTDWEIEIPSPSYIMNFTC